MLNERAHLSLHLVAIRYGVERHCTFERVFVRPRSRAHSRLTATMPRRTGPHAASANVSIARVCQAVLQRSQNVPICEDVDKRYIIYDYLCSVRYRLLRILMIIQWVSRSKAPLEQLTILNDYIDEKNRIYRRYAHRLCIQAAQIEQNLYPAWDVETAMHLLCHGRYPWFSVKSVSWPDVILPRRNITQARCRRDGRHRGANCCHEWML
ncbi:hypothetical protein BVRB_024520 [Beta vulgaris subsp. vulgaris]|uniref:Mediator of RNA polymerase II transcription subunit 14 n=1 Tax=Beta vulgaris subsp. vulgaris TaxID=3555 RepID=A0A0J8B2P2_BETVV|nr:hypothetical protein BVRB_024520 [Beta vulgaris subsp. vulgaris]